MFNSKEEIYIIVVLVSLFLLLLVVIIIVAAFLYYNRRKAHLLEVSEFQNTLLQSQLEIQEQTFKAIAQEIHDNIGQALSLAKLTLGTIPENENETVSEKINTSKSIIGKVIRDLRDLSRSINTDHIASIGLLQAIEEEIQLLDRSGAMEARLEVNGNPARLDKQKELILFRVVQEALHNIMKHAEAAMIKVVLDYDGQTLALCISDNGKGFVIAPRGHNGSGLRNMAERSRLIGASWDIKSVVGEGTQISISIPAIG